MRARRYLLAALAVISSAASATDWQALYARDSEAFWRSFEALISRASQCSSPAVVKSYLGASIELGGNSEVSERNAEVIESIAISNPQCLLAGLELLPPKLQSQVASVFLLHPLYHEPREISEPLEKLWSKGQFPASRRAFRKQMTANPSINPDAAR
jgi:hypothetical protein